LLLRQSNYVGAIRKLLSMSKKATRALQFVIKNQVFVEIRDYCNSVRDKPAAQDRRFTDLTADLPWPTLETLASHLPTLTSAITGALQQHRYIIDDFGKRYM